MSNKNETNVQIIENATRDDVQVGDHLTWEHTRERDGVTITERREGIAHYTDFNGDWCTEGGMWITHGEGEGITLTIRRTVREMPTDDGEVIASADGHKRIEAVDHGHTYYAREAVLSNGVWWAAWRTGAGGPVRAAVLPKQITPGTWKADGK